MPNKKKQIDHIELLAPAGSLEKLKYALHYGADAVYAGIPDFSMRYRINKFDKKTLKEGIEYVRGRKKKFYVTMNIYAHNYHILKIEKHLKFLKGLEVDGIIVSDPGIISMIKKHLPRVDIHLSTQANTTNWQAVRFWADQGIKRIVLARETTLKDIKEIKKHVPEMELEYFVHGAMCMSYSGRCILSKWMAGRSANLGDCAQPCRWKYNQTKKMSVEDHKGEFEIDLEEDGHGTYFFNSKDLNLLDHLDELKKAGVESFKIEGRNKSVYYLANVVRTYRKIIDAMQNKTPKKKIKQLAEDGQKELDKLVHRGYTAGFLAGGDPDHNFGVSHENSPYEFVGEIVGSDGNLITVKPHNAIYTDDKIEIIARSEIISVKIRKILDEDGKEVESAHGGQEKNFRIEIDKKNVEPMSLIRKKVK